MRIKNKKRLVARAERHLRADVEFTAFTYAAWRVRKNTAPPLKVCGIGCLAVPVRATRSKSAFDRFILGVAPHGPRGFAFCQKLENEFGIPDRLARRLEQEFMGLDTELDDKHPSAVRRTRVLGGLVVRFAKALPEGVEFNHDRLREMERQDGRNALLRWLRRGAPVKI